MGDGKARFEINRTDHDHLLDVETGQIHEFKSQELQRLIKEIADEMGFDLTEHRLEIYGRKQGRTACRCYEIKIYWGIEMDFAPPHPHFVPEFSLLSQKPLFQP